MSARLLAMLSLLTIAGCAGPEGSPPSLAPRPIEAIADEPARAVPPRESRADPALAARIDALVAEAKRGEVEFRAALPETQQTVERAEGAPAESEAWIEAQLALTALDATRGTTTTALGELDAILAGQAQSGEPVEVERFEAARERVLALHAGQVQAYAGLSAMITNQ